jgi:transcriptional regulator with XRE-family HTH domain
MDICFVIKARLQELGLGQKELAVAADVTQSYVSQLLTHKKLPPAPERTDIYQKMEKFLELPSGNLANLAQAQRMVELKRGLQEPPRPLFKEVRELILRKCKPERRAEVSQIFEQQPFGELERLVTQKLLDVIKRVARGELENDKWLRAFSRFSGRSYGHGCFQRLGRELRFFPRPTD